MFGCRAWPRWLHRHRSGGPHQWAERYTGLDIVAFAARSDNLQLFDELAKFFGARRPIPDQVALPKVHPLLPDYRFPSQILTESILGEALAEPRIAALREHLQDAELSSGPIRYCAPWLNANDIEVGGVDFLFSQAVLEHIDELDTAYEQMGRWVQPGGFASHEIDLRSHNMIQPWNGHWTFSDLEWRLVQGRWSYSLNRAPLSYHLECIERTGFKILNVDVNVLTDGLGRSQVARRFRDLPDSDFNASTAHVLARRL